MSGREEPQVALAWDPGLRVTEDQHSHFCTYSCLARGLAPDLAWTATAETCRGSLSLVTRERVPSPSHRHTEGRCQHSHTPEGCPVAARGTKAGGCQRAPICQRQCPPNTVIPGAAQRSVGPGANARRGRRDRPKASRQACPIPAPASGSLRPSPPPAGSWCRAAHLFLLLQDHFHPVHRDHDAHFLLLDVLGFELVLWEGRDREAQSEQSAGRPAAPNWDDGVLRTRGTGASGRAAARAPWVGTATLHGHRSHRSALGRTTERTWCP